MPLGCIALRCLAKSLFVLAVALAAGCASAVPQHSVLRNVGSSLQGLRNRVTKVIGPGARGGLAGFDGRPLLIDLRNAILRLPQTLRLDVVPFVDNHVGVRFDESGSDSRPHTTLSRAFAKIQ